MPADRPDFKQVVHHGKEAEEAQDVLPGYEKALEEAVATCPHCHKGIGKPSSGPKPRGNIAVRYYVCESCDKTWNIELQPEILIALNYKLPDGTKVREPLHDEADIELIRRRLDDLTSRKLPGTWRSS